MNNQARAMVQISLQNAEIDVARALANLQSALAVAQGPKGAQVSRSISIAITQAETAVLWARYALEIFEGLDREV